MVKKTGIISLILLIGMLSFIAGTEVFQDMDMRENDIFNVTNVNSSNGFFNKVFSNDWTNVSITESQISDFGNYIPWSSEGNLNVNSSIYADKLDGEDGSYYLDNTDSQTLSVENNVDGTKNTNVSISSGNEIQIEDYYEANTNTQLDDEVPTSNVDMNSKNMTSVDCIKFDSGGEICSS